MDSEAARQVDTVFGFGRRVCPGQAFAESNIFLVMSNIIATMDLTKAVDEAGVPITPPVEYTKSFIRCVPFGWRYHWLRELTKPLGTSYRSSTNCNTVPQRRGPSSSKRTSSRAKRRTTSPSGPPFHARLRPRSTYILRLTDWWPAPWACIVPECSILSRMILPPFLGQQKVYSSSFVWISLQILLWVHVRSLDITITVTVTATRSPVDDSKGVWERGI